jgi:hypothetical protein
MPTFAVVVDGIVENCIVAESLEIAEESTGKTCIEYEPDGSVSKGFSYADGIFVDPNPPAPIEVPTEEVPVEEVPVEE